MLCIQIYEAGVAPASESGDQCTYHHFETHWQDITTDESMSISNTDESIEQQLTCMSMYKKTEYGEAAHRQKSWLCNLFISSYHLRSSTLYESILPRLSSLRVPLY